MQAYIELIIIFALIVVQSIFGVGLLLFGTPSLLLLGYDFANTLNILMPVSITISAVQFFKSKVKDRIFIKDYNIFCIPFLIIFLFIALKFNYLFDFRFLVALLLIFSSVLILNKKKFSSFKQMIFKIKNLILIVIGLIHGLTNMGGSFLAIYSTLISKSIKEVTRYYISYGYLIMGTIQYLMVLFLSYDLLIFNKIYYVFLALIIYFPAQKIFKNLNDRKFSKYLNLIALIYGLSILVYYY